MQSPKTTPPVSPTFAAVLMMPKLEPFILSNEAALSINYSLCEGFLEYHKEVESAMREVRARPGFF